LAHEKEKDEAITRRLPLEPPYGSSRRIDACWTPDQ